MPSGQSFWTTSFWKVIRTASSMSVTMELKEDFTPESSPIPLIILKSESHCICSYEHDLIHCFNVEYSLQAFVTRAGVPVLVV